MKKKICLTLLGLLLIVGTSLSVSSEVLTTRKRQVNTPTAPSTTPTQTTTNTTPQTTNTNVTSQNKQIANKLSNSVKTCKPYSESLITSVYGVNTSFDIAIKGWSNNKCIIDFVANTYGASSNFKSIYGVDASSAQIHSFAPKIHCAFSQQQLSRVGDSILEESSRANGNKMLKNPQDIDMSMFTNMTSSDSELMNIVFNEQACQIENMDDLFNFKNLMNMF